MNLKVLKIKDNAKLPIRATATSAGADLYACIDSSITIEPGMSVVIPTGIAVELPRDDLVGLVTARSGLAIKHGITLSNGVGVIDSDYRGEIQVGLINQSANSYTIEPHERIAQFIIMPVLLANIVESDELSGTDRGEGGFGSTGKN